MPRHPGALRRRAAGMALLVLLLLVCGAPSGTAAEPGPAPVDAQALAGRLYASGQAPHWLEGGQHQARLALDLLAAAAEHGLDPAYYRSAELSDRLAALRGPGDEAAFERALSTAVLQYLADLRAGRTRSPYRPQGDALAGFDPVEHLRQAVRSGGLAQAVETAAPALPLYRRVKETLARYRALAADAPEWPALPAGAGPTLAVGDAYAGAPALRARLRMLGDLGPEQEAGGEEAGREPVYTPALAAAVRRFQARHNLVEDGLLGPATRTALAVPPAQRALQLGLTLERLRWLPPLRGRVVAVNVPTYRLWAFETGRDTTEPLEMRVIVGKAAGTPTPLFIGQMRFLEFNPYWNVPRSIAIGEILPKLVRNPAYLRRNDMELVMPDGRVLAQPNAVSLAALRAGAARIRQRPGPRNALGEVKFAMPNPMSIYLHSTSAKELFDKARRDLSHGCIRVEHAAELAQFVLADPANWGPGQVAAAMQPGPTRTVALAAPVPVILFYATAVTDQHGRALFAEDIYGRDRHLAKALRPP
ncbi:L,D-transpeptidase family protein [Massilia sp. UMI-21]|nr:L,D-transpeptidase family protein [Massilia sp. UMI-21]